MSDRTWKTLSSPWLLLLSALLLAWFLATVLPRESARAEAYTPEGASFDTSLFYPPARALERAAAYSVEQRFAYIAARWSFDLAWPFAYGLFVLASWAFSLARLAPGFRGARLLALLTLLGPAFDFVENVAATVLLASAPGGPAWAALAASAGTALKWLFVLIGMIGALALPAALGLRGLVRALARRR